MATVLAERLKKAVKEAGRRLREISEADSAIRTTGGDGWSRKQELGHLLDSATNNRARFTVAALEGQYSGPTYDATGWAEFGGYADTAWTELLELWERMNISIATVVTRVPEDRLHAPCKIGNSAPVTLEFLIDDYILHMQHHLDHILARDHMTSYPGATIGV